MRTRTPATLLAAGALIVGTALPAWADEYTVRSGDTLSHIAARHDVPGGWLALYKANRATVGGNPHLIYPGQVLSLDVGAAKERRRAAEKADASTSKVRPATGRVTSHFGMRTHPVTGVYKLHRGTDFAYGDGVARAALGGRVVDASWHAGWGRMVAVRHGDGVTTRYAHLARYLVSVGDRVRSGEPVGRIGSSGYSTGPHLEFQVVINGGYVNPMTWLRR